MAADDLTFTDLDDLTEALEVAGVATFLDPREIRPPGVWVQFLGPGSEDNTPLSGGVMRLVLYPVVAANTDLRRELDNLAALWNQVRPVLQAFGGPSAEVTTTGLQLPTGGTPQPALRVPLDLFTEGETP